MTITQVAEANAPSVVDVVELAERHLEQALLTLSEAVSRMTQAGADDDEEVQGAALEVVAALRILFVLRARIENDDKRFGSTEAGGPAIDLEDARSAIGSLLDRLRDEDDADEVSE